VKVDQVDLEVTQVPSSLVRVSRLLTELYFPLCHRIEHRGKGHWPKSGPVVVASNHPTYFDPWLIGMATPRYVRWMAWDEIFEWPVVGQAVRAYGALPINVEKLKPSTFRGAHDVIQRQGALGIFPEGGRTSGKSELDPLKPGVARLMLALGAPILPVSIRGARRAWPRERAYPLPGPKITVTYHPVVDPKKFRPELSKRDREQAFSETLHATIRSAL
jgi:1-acyl-sn-glycerol-3-phosphate acyltransferase